MLTHVDSQLPKVGVKLTRETQTSCGAGHDNGNKVVKIAIRGCREFQRPEANIVKGFVINAERLVRVLHKLMNGESGIVGLKKKSRINSLPALK
jgi:hypothetical protein